MEYRYKQTSRTAGILIILGIITGILSITPSIDSDNFLKAIYPDKNQVLNASVYQFFLIPIYVGFSLVLYPILKHNNQTLSIGFLGFRFMAAAFQLIGIILLPLFVLYQ